MGLMDKVKAQASQVVEKGKEAGKLGQQKIEGLQVKKQADNLLRELGAHHFAKAKGRGDAQTDTKIAGVMAQLDAHEAEHGQIDLTPDPVVQGTTDAAGGMAPPVSNVVASSVVTSAPDVSGLPSGVGGLPPAGVGGVPAGNVGGIPSGNVGGIPSGNVGGVPQGGVGETSQA
jgi:hypothetical protein